jgi:hypothetical protein
MGGTLANASRPGLALEPAARGDGGSLSAWSAQDVFAVLVVIGFANGIAKEAVQSVKDAGLAHAVFDTFGVSIILWAGCAVAAVMLARAPRRELQPRDLAVACCACLCFLVPVPEVSWAGIVLIALHLRLSAVDAANRAAAAVVFALTIPVFWTRLVFMFFTEPVLAADARLVALITGTTPRGNLVPFADGSGAIYLQPGCSSLVNLSLALLSAMLFLHARGGRWTALNVSWTLVSLVLVAVINIVRMGLMGLSPEHYTLLHGPVGASAAGWLSAAVILLIGYLGIGRDAVDPA